MLLAVVALVALAACADPSAAGPALVEAAPAGGDVVAGTLQIAGGCVTLSERGHRLLSLGWPVGATGWDADRSAIEFDGSFSGVLQDGDRVTLSGRLVADHDQVAWTRPPGRACRGEAVMLVADVTEVVKASAAGDQEVGEPHAPIGGGRGAGTGSDLPLDCPPGVGTADEEWFGPAGLTRWGAVAEALGDLGLGWVGEPVEIEATDTWSSWGLRDGSDRLVAVITVVASDGGWDPSHARYCPLPEPSPPPPPLTLYVSNQSFDDPNVSIVITIDGEVVVDQEFAVEGQHNWVAFAPHLDPGEHTLQATSSTGAELTVEFTLPEDEPRWAVVEYWHSAEEGPTRFTFDISDEPLAFA